MARISASDIKAQEDAEAAELMKTEGNDSPALRNIGKALFPDGFSDAEVGSLDKEAAMNGEVKYTNGDEFKRQDIVDAITDKLAAISDLALLTLQKEVLALPDKSAAPDVSTPAPTMADANGTVDTSVLTGPRGNLKNFLLESQRNKESQ